MKLYKLIFPLIFVSGCISSNVIDSHTSPKSKRSVIAIQKGELLFIREMKPNIDEQIIRTPNITHNIKSNSIGI